MEELQKISTIPDQLVVFLLASGKIYIKKSFNVSSFILLLKFNYDTREKKFKMKFPNLNFFAVFL